MVSQRSPGDAVLVGQVPAQEGEIGRPPGGDILVIVAVGEVAANDQKLGSRERMKDPPKLTLKRAPTAADFDALVACIGMTIGRERMTGSGGSSKPSGGSANWRRCWRRAGD